MVDFKALGAKAAQTVRDMTQAVKGGDYTPPAEGPCKLRFVGYIEIGKHEKKFKGVPKTRERALLVFELSGPNHTPTTLDDGTKVPQRITIDEAVSLNEKANFFKLFNRMNWHGKAKHFVELLGEAYAGVVVHRKFKKAGDVEGKPTGIVAELRNDDGYTIKPPRFEVTDENGPTGVWKDMTVDPAITAPKAFVWDLADMEQWQSIYIDGKYDDRTVDGKTQPGKSKNVFQARIMQAKNFAGSPIATLLKAGGHALTLPDVDSPEGPGSDDDDGQPEAPALAKDERPVPTGQAATDALAGIVG